jgi:hypothetical protein
MEVMAKLLVVALKNVACPFENNNLGKPLKNYAFSPKNSALAMLSRFGLSSSSSRFAFYDINRQGRRCGFREGLGWLAGESLPIESASVRLEGWHRQ